MRINVDEYNQNILYTGMLKNKCFIRDKKYTVKR